jgi:uncharacterized protein
MVGLSEDFRPGLRGRRRRTSASGLGSCPPPTKIEHIERDSPVKTKTRLLFAVAVASAVASTALADTKSHRKAAEDLLTAMGVEAQMSKAIDTQLDAQTKMMPMMAQLKEPMKKFFDKYMSYASMKEELITNYVDAFSEKDLKEITAFYKSPVGKKLVGKMPELMSKATELGTKRVQENQAELQKMVQEELAKPKK